MRYNVQYNPSLKVITMSMIPEVFDSLECNELYEQRFFDTLHLITDEPEQSTVPASSTTSTSFLYNKVRKVVTRSYSYPLEHDPLVMESSGFTFS